MALVNGYCTLQEFKDFVVTPGQTIAEAATDDTVIENLIQAASRYIDNTTYRHFYPSIETRYFDTPNDDELWFDDDLLAVATFTNGDANTIASTEYNLLPKNASPYYALRLKEASTTSWESDSSGNTEFVLQMLAVWGYRSLYSQRAWGAGSTLNEGGTLTASDLTWTMTSGSAFAAGQIVKIEDELAIVDSVAGLDVTMVARGENGSTAATHADATAVTIWQVEDAIREACLEICRAAYRRRWGENVSGTATITGAGIVITPQDVPSGARELMRNYRRAVLWP